MLCWVLTDDIQPHAHFCVSCVDYCAVPTKPKELTLLVVYYGRVASQHTVPIVFNGTAQFCARRNNSGSRNSHFSFYYGGNHKNRTLAAFLLLMSGENARDLRHWAGGCEMHQKCMSLMRDAWDLAGLLTTTPHPTNRNYNSKTTQLTSFGRPSPRNHPNNIILANKLHQGYYWLIGHTKRRRDDGTMGQTLGQQGQ